MAERNFSAHPLARQRSEIWLTFLIGVVAALLLGSLVSDASLDAQYGWDTRVNCAAVDAHAAGLDPYYVKNLKDTKLSYPYLPVTLDAFRPICAGGLLLTHYRGLFLAIALLCGLLLPGIASGRSTVRDVSLRVLCIGGFLGFEWTWASGNFVIFTGLLTAVSLALLLPSERPAGESELDFPFRLIGAALLGLLLSFKLVFFPVVAALYLLPLSRARKVTLIATASAMFALPIVISMTLYADLFHSWLSAISGQIQGQHSVALGERNPSFFVLAMDLATRLGLADQRPVVFALYAACVLGVVAPLVLTAVRSMGDYGKSRRNSFLMRLDCWLIEHPRQAARLTAIAMYALYLCSPRLKEYAFFELAIYAAVLIAGLRPASIAIILVCAIGLPASASLFGYAFMDSFGPLSAAVICYGTMLLDFGAVQAASSGDRLAPRSLAASCDDACLAPEEVPSLGDWRARQLATVASPESR
ncbi:hypothetical protein [Bradyrhizobium sp. Cp5.3]|uniref:hypothetical protein n=1 Tax=Bradyrhizobium sp. Cp5.3 TaxID=443598 RepID=UPI0003FC2359|nr:hypothetical protein [Bradyrhizobium sp. Cp5.3]